MRGAITAGSGFMRIDKGELDNWRAEAYSEHSARTSSAQLNSVQIFIPMAYLDEGITASLSELDAVIAYKVLDSGVNMGPCG